MTVASGKDPSGVPAAYQFRPWALLPLPAMCMSGCPSSPIGTEATSDPRKSRVNSASPAWRRLKRGVASGAQCGRRANTANHASTTSAAAADPAPVIAEQAEAFALGQDLLAVSKRELAALRGDDIAMIFQEPMTALNPVFTVGNQIIEAVRLHQGKSRKEALEVAAVEGDLGLQEGERLARLRDLGEIQRALLCRGQSPRLRQGIAGLEAPSPA